MLLLTFSVTYGIVRRDSEMAKIITVLWSVKDKIVIDAIYGVALSRMKLAIEALLVHVIEIIDTKKGPRRKARANLHSYITSTRKAIFEVLCAHLLICVMPKCG
jgi:hypothetical protein